MLPFGAKKILEVGCGRGDWFKEFEKWGSSSDHFSGIDLDPDLVENAKKRFPQADLRTADASRLPWTNETFDLVWQATLFTSILDKDYKIQAAKEMLRVLKPNGLILWYDFFYDNPKNPNVKGIGSSEIKILFPGCRIEFKRITLAPPIARWLAPKSWSACLILEKIKILNTHYLAVIRPEAKS